MINFPILYTGKGTEQPLKDMGDSYEVFSRKFMDAQRMKMEKHLSDEKFMLEQGIDPIQLISDTAMQKQGSDIDWYNKKWAGRMAQNEGFLSTQDKMEMGSDKRKIMASQQKSQAAQERAMVDYETIRRDTRGYYDHRVFEDAYKEFLVTGEYPASALEPSPLNPTVYFGNINLKGEKGTIVTDAKTGQRMKYYASIDEAKARFWGDIQEDIGKGGSRLLKGIRNEFNNLPSSEKKKILDINGDNRISPEEERFMGLEGSLRTNPIMQWAEQTYPQMMLRGTPMKGETKKETTSEKKIDWNKEINEWNSNNDEFGRQRTQYGDMVFDSFLNLGAVSKAMKAQNIGEATDLKTGNKIIMNTGVKFEVSGYDVKTDLLIIRALEDISGADGRMRKGESYAVPAAKFDDLLKSKPYGICRRGFIAEGGAAVNEGKYDNL